MTFAVMIPTRNRPRELELTCTALSNLRPAPDEVLICADGCEVDTSPAWTREVPRLKLLRNDSRRGSIYSRDRMLRLATSDIVVSLDDDSHPVRADFLERLASCFEMHPETAVIVFQELRSSSLLLPRNTEPSRGHYVAAYANCAAAMRREVYLALPGFPGFFEHMYEEPDYALQCYAAGYGVWFEPSLVVAHRQSPVNREPIQRHHLNARNELSSVWLRCPWPWLPLVAGYRIARQLLHAASRGLNCVLQEPSWWVSALKCIRPCLNHRQPVPWGVYYRWMRLARRPVYTPEEFSAMFRTSVDLIAQIATASAAGPLRAH